MVRHHQRIFAQIKLFLIFQTSRKWSVMIYIIIQYYKLDENVVWSSAIEDFSTLLSLKFAEFTYSKSPCKICERKYRSFCGIFLPTWQCDYSKLVSIIGLGIAILYTAVSLISFKFTNCVIDLFAENYLNKLNFCLFYLGQREFQCGHCVTSCKKAKTHFHHTKEFSPFIYILYLCLLFYIVSDPCDLCYITKSVLFLDGKIISLNHISKT